MRRRRILNPPLLLFEKVQLGDIKSGYLGGLIGVALGSVVWITSTGWITQRWSSFSKYNRALEEKQ